MTDFRIMRWLGKRLNWVVFFFDRHTSKVCILTAGLLVFLSLTSLRAQCPPNIGFENGNFSNWTFYSGWFELSTRYLEQPTSSALPGRHTIIKKSDHQNEKDPYGNFPVNCPNGSNHSVKLGNNESKGEVDGVGYTITIPADKDVYSIIYNYAVVLENPVGHQDVEQPKFSAKVFDVATNQYIQCSSFDFTSSANLPGFKLSTSTLAGNTMVYYKTWSPITIKLVGYAGKTMRIEFRISDCTLGAHFGYAYLDINEDCSTPIVGNKICNGMDSTILVAPFGFREYRWFNADFSRVLGTTNTLRLSPAPPAGTVFAVEVKPYPGSGCVDTFYTSIEHTPVPFRFQLADSAGACVPLTTDLTSPHLTAGSSAGLRYTYHTDSTLTSYVERPEAIEGNGKYYIKAANAEGCLDIKPIIVSQDTGSVFTVTSPPITYYPNTVDITLPSLISSPMHGMRYRYWKDANASIPVPDPRAVEVGGVYYVEGITQFGCTAVKPMNVPMQVAPPPNVFSPNGDGIHDTWIIPGLNGYPQARVDVYDRYGRVVFHSIGYNQPWNGTRNGKVLPVATYYFVIKTADGLQPLTGSVTIIK
jgi:gliding motility-associated-like protein